MAICDRVICRAFVWKAKVLPLHNARSTTLGTISYPCGRQVQLVHAYVSVGPQSGMFLVSLRLPLERCNGVLGFAEHHLPRTE